MFDTTAKIKLCGLALFAAITGGGWAVIEAMHKVITLPNFVAKTV